MCVYLYMRIENIKFTIKVVVIVFFAQYRKMHSIGILLVRVCY